MPLATLLNSLKSLLCVLLGLSYLSSPAFATTSHATQIQEPARQVVLACNTRNLERFIGTASQGGALDPAQQFALIRARVLTY
jgi:hypothetical protein